MTAVVDPSEGATFSLPSWLVVISALVFARSSASPTRHSKCTSSNHSPFSVGRSRFQNVLGGGPERRAQLDRQPFWLVALSNSEPLIPQFVANRRCISRIKVAVFLP